MIKVDTNHNPPLCTREPLPHFLVGSLDAASLANLSWVPEPHAEEVRGISYLDERPVLPEVANPETHAIDYATEAYELAEEAGIPVALVHYGIRELTAEELQAMQQRRAAELEAAKRDKLTVANRECDLRINALTSTYPATEVLTFSKQEAEARAYQANSASATPMIDALSVNRGIDKAELTGRIIAKADLFAQYTGMIVGFRQALEDAVNAATTAAAVAAIDPLAGWPA